MIKYLISMMIMSNLVAFEWIDNNKCPYPENERIIFFDAITNQIYCDTPEAIKMAFFYTYGDFPAITHWAELPEKPVVIVKLLETLE